MRPYIELRGHADYVHAIARSPDGTRLVSGSGDGTVRIWDSRSVQARAKRAAENLTPRWRRYATKKCGTNRPRTLGSICGHAHALCSRIVAWPCVDTKHASKRIQILRSLLPCLICRRQDLNLHDLVGHQALNLARLPIPPLRLLVFK